MLGLEIHVHEIIIVIDRKQNQNIFRHVLFRSYQSQWPSCVTEWLHG